MPAAGSDFFARVRELGLRLPGVEVSTSYGTPSLKVSKKFLCRMKEDGETLVLKLGAMEEKEMLMEQQPDIFFETPHYVGWSGVLVRLSRIGDAELARLLEECWRRCAGKRLLAARAAQLAAAPSPQAPGAAPSPQAPGAARSPRPSPAGRKRSPPVKKRAAKRSAR